MKYYTLLLAIFLLNSCCASKKAVNTLDNQNPITKKTLQNNDTTIEYSASTRGYFLSIAVNEELISIQNERDGKIVTKPCSEEIWSNLTTVLSAIDLTTISDLKAPTDARQYDGAPFGLLKIKQADNTYQSSNFDHGFPPEEIKALVELILSLDEKG